MKDGFVRVAAGTPAIRAGDTRGNAQAIAALIREAEAAGAKALVLGDAVGAVPYREDGEKCEDGVHHPILIQDGSFTSLASLLWLVESDCAVPIDGDSRAARRASSTCCRVASARESSSRGY